MPGERLARERSSAVPARRNYKVRYRRNNNICVSYLRRCWDRGLVTTFAVLREGLTGKQKWLGKRGVGRKCILDRAVVNSIESCLRSKAPGRPTLITTTITTSAISTTIAVIPTASARLDPRRPVFSDAASGGG